MGLKRRPSIKARPAVPAPKTSPAVPVTKASPATPATSKAPPSPQVSTTVSAKPKQSARRIPVAPASAPLAAAVLELLQEEKRQAQADAGVPEPLGDDDKTHRVATADVIEELAADLFSTTADDEPLPGGGGDAGGDDDDDLSLWGQKKNTDPEPQADSGGLVQGSWTQDGADDPDKTTVFSRAGTDVDDSSWDESSTDSAETTKVEHSFELSASPQDVYDVYMDDQMHAELTGKSASIERFEGGHMEVLDGDVIGDFVELDDGSRIVQTWRSSVWSEDDESSQLTLTFEQTDDGAGTKITMLQEDVPVEQADGTRDVFEEYYWEPLKQRFS